MVSKTRKLSGMKFKLSKFSIYNGYVNKNDANKMAKNYRNKGFFARVLPDSSSKNRGYLIYIRNQDLPKRLIDQTYEDIWTGDWDADGTKNIDDKKPFDDSVDQPVNTEVSLSESWENLEDKRQEYKKNIKKLAKKVGIKPDKKTGEGYRVKEKYSIIGKQIGRNLDTLQDMGGLRVIEKNRRQLKKKARKVRDSFDKDNVLEYEDKYRKANTKDLDTPYRAIHLNVEYKDDPYEIQFNTPKMREIADIAHIPYKRGDKKTLKKLREWSDREYEKGQ